MLMDWIWVSQKDLLKKKKNRIGLDQVEVMRFAKFSI